MEHHHPTGFYGQRHGFTDVDLVDSNCGLRFWAVGLHAEPVTTGDNLQAPIIDRCVGNRTPGSHHFGLVSLF